MLNRSCVVVRPAQGYIDWAVGLDDSGIVPQVTGEQTVYLIPEYENDEHATYLLSQCFESIFELELMSWHTDETDWPKKRTFKMFCEWFAFEFHSVVEDLCGYDFVDDSEWQ